MWWCASSGTSPGRIRKRSACVPGRSRFFTGCSATICCPSTSSSTATTSSKRSTGRSRPASTTSASRSCEGDTRRPSGRLRSASIPLCGTHRRGSIGRRRSAGCETRWVYATSGSCSASIDWITPKAFPIAFAPSSGCWSGIRNGESGPCSCRSGRRAAISWRATRRSARRWTRSWRTSTAAIERTTGSRSCTCTNTGSRRRLPLSIAPPPCAWCRHCTTG